MKPNDVHIKNITGGQDGVFGLGDDDKVYRLSLTTGEWNTIPRKTE